MTVLVFFSGCAVPSILSGGEHTKFYLSKSLMGAVYWATASVHRSQYYAAKGLADAESAVGIKEARSRNLVTRLSHEFALNLAVDPDALGEDLVHRVDMVAKKMNSIKQPTESQLALLKSSFENIKIARFYQERAFTGANMITTRLLITNLNEELNDVLRHEDMSDVLVKVKALPNAIAQYSKNFDSFESAASEINALNDFSDVSDAITTLVASRVSKEDSDIRALMSRNDVGQP